MSRRRKVKLWDTYSEWKVPQRGRKNKKKVVSSQEERKATKDYEQSTLKVVKQATCESTPLNRQEHIDSRKEYWSDKQYVSRRLL